MALARLAGTFAQPRRVEECEPRRRTAAADAARSLLSFVFGGPQDARSPLAKSPQSQEPYFGLPANEQQTAGLSASNLVIFKRT